MPWLMLEGVNTDFKYITWEQFDKEIETSRGRSRVSRDYGWRCPKCGRINYGYPRRCKECDK